MKQFTLEEKNQVLENPFIHIIENWMYYSI